MYIVYRCREWASDQSVARNQSTCTHTHTHTHTHTQKSKQLLAKKEEGNTAFKLGRMEEAYRLYTEALDIDHLNTFTNAKLYCNRALVGSKVSPCFH